MTNRKVPDLMAALEDSLALRASDYEEYLGDHRWQIYKGNPKYCQVAVVHEPHEFRYVYLDSRDEITRGTYTCDGFGIEYPEKVREQPTMKKGG